MKSQPIITMLLLLAAPTAAQTPSVAPSSDNLAVRSVIGAYLYGLKHNNVDSLKQAFLADAKLYFTKRDGTLGQLSQVEWYKGFAASAGKVEEGDLRIASLEITKDIATVKVIERYATSEYTDYLNLVRISGRWRIVNKVYTSEPRETRAMTDSMPPRRISMTRPIEVPMLTANPRDKRPEIEVMVNGQGPFRFGVETGARLINVSHALATRLGLKSIGANADTVPLYHLDSINVATAGFHDMTVAETPPGVDGVDGVLGLPFYQDLLLTLDYPAGLVRLARDSLPAADGKEILAITRVSDFWGLPLSIEGKPYLGILDTQSGGAVIVPPVIADQLAFVAPPQVVGRARGTFGVVEIKRAKLTGDVQIGRYTVPAPGVDVIQLPPEFPNQPNIGAKLLSQFVVSLDQRHARLRLVRAGSPVVNIQ